MAEKKERKKDPKVTDAEITEDGCLIVTFNQDVGYPNIKKTLFTPDALLVLSEECADIPPKEGNDFPGIPVVDQESIFEDENAPEDEGKKDEE